MSAYVVDRDHIVYLIMAGNSRRLRGHHGGNLSYWTNEKGHTVIGDDITQATAGQILWNANIQSINARYPDTIENPDNMPGPLNEDFILTDADFRKPWAVYDPVQVLQSCACFAYQACEFDGWETSEAHTLLNAIKERAIRALPGYNDCAWGSPNRSSQKVVPFPKPQPKAKPDPLIEENKILKARLSGLKEIATRTLEQYT